jgi:hypothetical protein
MVLAVPGSPVRLRRAISLLLLLVLRPAAFLVARNLLPDNTQVIYAKAFGCRRFFNVAVRGPLQLSLGFGSVLRAERVAGANRTLVHYHYPVSFLLIPCLALCRTFTGGW